MVPCWTWTLNLLYIFMEVFIIIKQIKEFVLRTYCWTWSTSEIRWNKHFFIFRLSHLVKFPVLFSCLLKWWAVNWSITESLQKLIQQKRQDLAMNLKLDSKHVAHIHVNSYWSATSMNFASANQRVVRIVYSSLFGSPLLISSRTWNNIISLAQTP